jgi:hypothetical protein
MKPLCAYFDYISFKIQKVMLVVEYYLIERKRIRSSKLTVCLPQTLFSVYIQKPIYFSIGFGQRAIAELVSIIAPTKRLQNYYWPKMHFNANIQ